MLNKPAIILVNPQMGENIGAAARVMKNFALNDLRLVSPRDGWPNAKAIAMSAGASDLINEAKIFDDLSEAIADLEHIYATTAIPRDMSKDYIYSTELNSSYPLHTKIGFIFGRENNGLTNKELSLANQIITINTNIDCSSINLAQAVGIICYELSKLEPPQPLIIDGSSKASAHELSLYLMHLFDKLGDTQFFRQEEKKAATELNITNIFTRIKALTKNEVKILYGIVKALSSDEK